MCGLKWVIKSLLQKMVSSKPKYVASVKLWVDSGILAKHQIFWPAQDEILILFRSLLRMFAIELVTLGKEDVWPAHPLTPFDGIEAAVGIPVTRVSDVLKGGRLYLTLCHRVQFPYSLWGNWTLLTLHKGSPITPWSGAAPPLAPAAPSAKFSWLTVTTGYAL